MLFGRKNYNSSKIETQIMKILTIIKKKNKSFIFIFKKKVYKTILLSMKVRQLKKIIILIKVGSSHQEPVDRVRTSSKS